MIAAAVTEQPQVITESDVAVAREVAEHAEPVVEPQEETADIEEVAETAEVVVAEPEVVAQPAAPVVAEVAAEVETVAAVEPENTVEHNHATAPMTRAPAPEYVPEAPRHSDWQRPTFAFEGKGAAGGHTATHHASAAPARVRNLLSNNSSVIKPVIAAGFFFISSLNQHIKIHQMASLLTNNAK